MKKLFRCAATGDAMITRCLPPGGDYPGFAEVRNFIRQADFCYGNLETTIHNYESFGSARSGGSWLCSPPEVLDDLKKFGINILSCANNHQLDYSYGGLARTMHYLRAAGLPFCGIGNSLTEASCPVYLDTPGGRYALIGCTMTTHPEHRAGEAAPHVPGRPGLNSIRIQKKYLLPPEQLQELKAIAAALGINQHDDVIRGEGYLPALKPGEFHFSRDLEFWESDHPETAASAHPEDLKRTTDAIAEARGPADYVVVSMHSHELAGISKELVDPVSISFAHACIDAGADAVIGTGPHLLRPMEIYGGKPIFYSLGDFVMQLETISHAPADMFFKQKLPATATMAELFDKRSGGGKRGLSYDPVMYKSVVPYWEADAEGVTRIVLLPVEENFRLPRSQSGWPSPDDSQGIIEHFAELSAPYGVNIIHRDGVGIVELR